MGGFNTNIRRVVELAKVGQLTADGQLQGGVFDLFLTKTEEKPFWAVKVQEAAFDNKFQQGFLGRLVVTPGYAAGSKEHRPYLAPIEQMRSESENRPATWAKAGVALFAEVGLACGWSSTHTLFGYVGDRPSEGGAGFDASIPARSELDGDLVKFLKAAIEQLWAYDAEAKWAVSREAAVNAARKLKSLGIDCSEPRAADKANVGARKGGRGPMGQVEVAVEASSAREAIV